MTKKFDLIVIGGGAGGFASVLEARKRGLKTLFVNEGLPWGGTCVNVGCVPTKKLLHEGQKGKEWGKALRETRETVGALRKEKYEKILRNFEGVETRRGRAVFEEEDKVRVGSEVFGAQKIIVATGSSQRIPTEIKGIKEAGFWDHQSVLEKEEMAGSVAVLGGGPLGVEFAQIFNAFGAKVYLLHKGERILPFAEKELTEDLQNFLREKGIEILVGTVIREVRKERGKKVVIFEKEGREEKVEVEEVFLAVGKRANTQGLGLEKAGVKTNKKGQIVVNEFLQTSNERVFAVGDVASLPLRLETTAGREGTLAVRNAFDENKEKIDYRAVPYTVFGFLELAGVGYTEERQIKEFGRCYCSSVDFSVLPRAIIEDKKKGKIKMVVDPNTQKILGVSIWGYRASDLILPGALAVKQGLTLRELWEILPVFPSFSEIYRYAVLSFFGDITKLSCCV